MPVLQRLEESLAAVPGVQDLTLTAEPLFSGSAIGATFIPEGMQRKAEGNPGVLVNRVEEIPSQPSEFAFRPVADLTATTEVRCNLLVLRSHIQHWQVRVYLPDRITQRRRQHLT